MSLTNEQLAEGERLIQAARRGLSPHCESDLVGWIALHGPQLLAAAREREALQARIANLEGELEWAQAELQVAQDAMREDAEGKP